MINGSPIPNIPGTRKPFYYFKRVTGYVVSVQITASKSGYYKESSFLIGKFGTAQTLSVNDFQSYKLLIISKDSGLQFCKNEPRIEIVLDVNTPNKVV